MNKIIMPIDANQMGMSNTQSHSITVRHKNKPEYKVLLRALCQTGYLSMKDHSHFISALSLHEV